MRRVADDELVYLPERDQSFTEHRCFLCGATLDADSRTDEHVFPRWLLAEHKLWHERMGLLNGTSIKYAQLTIPCCSECNNVHLSKIERDVAAAFRSGPEAVQELDPDTLFTWMAKIYYGLLFRELLLPIDRRRDSTSILEPEALAQFRMHHLLLQAARGVVIWEPPGPASTAVFRCQTSSDRRANFDYGDHFVRPFLAVRSGSVALVATLQDWGALNEVDLFPFEAARQVELHPLQFRALVAVGQQMNYLFNRTPKHSLIHAGDRIRVLTHPLAGLSGGSLFDSWDDSTYAQLLARALEQPLETVWDGQRLTDLLGRPDSPMFMEWDGSRNRTLVSHRSEDELRNLGVQL